MIDTIIFMVVRNILKRIDKLFADDTHLFNKNDESVKKSFDILTIYEKASGSKVNSAKTKGKYMYIGWA